MNLELMRKHLITARKTSLPEGSCDTSWACKPLYVYRFLADIVVWHRLS